MECPYPLFTHSISYPRVLPSLQMLCHTIHHSTIYIFLFARIGRSKCTEEKKGVRFLLSSNSMPGKSIWILFWTPKRTAFKLVVVLLVNLMLREFDFEFENLILCWNILGVNSPRLPMTTCKVVYFRRCTENFLSVHASWLENQQRSDLQLSERLASLGNHLCLIEDTP